VFLLHTIRIFARKHILLVGARTAVSYTNSQLSLVLGLRSLIILTIWEIWKERKNRVFSRQSRSESGILSGIHDEARHPPLVSGGNKKLKLLLPALPDGEH
jgi:hypothetical protein